MLINLSAHYAQPVVTQQRAAVVYLLIIDLKIAALGYALVAEAIAGQRALTVGQQRTVIAGISRIEDELRRL